MSPKVRRRRSLTLGVVVAKSALAHIRQLNRALRASIHEPVTALWVEFCGRNNLSQLLHVRWLDIDDVEALILNIQVPEVYPQIIGRDERLSIAVDGDAVDVVGMRIGVCSAWHSGNNRIMVCKAWQLQIVCAVKVNVILRANRAPTSCSRAWSQIMREVVLRNDLQTLLKHLP